MSEILTPSTLWEDFDPTFTGKISEITTEGCKRFAVTVETEPDGDIVVDTYIYGDRNNGNIVLLIGDVAKKAQSEIVEKLVLRGFTVVLPDYSGVFEDTVTHYPYSKKYGFYEYSAEHLVRVVPTAKETCFYLYTRVVRKIISALKQKFQNCDIIVMGLKVGTEIALQTAGTDDRIVGLALIAGAGYREYVDFPKFASQKVLMPDDDAVAWLTAVSGTAYAKKITVPTIIALGSNGVTSDLDRVSNLMALIQGQTALAVSAGLRDSIDGNCFETVLKWLEMAFVDSLPPKNPVVTVKVNSDGEIYGEIATDDCLGIKEVRVKYSWDDNNHSTRFWDNAKGEFIGNGEYIAKLSAGKGKKMLFAYPEAEYKNGLVFNGTVVYCDLSANKTNTKKSFLNPIVFQYPDESAFVEISEDTVIFDSSLKVGVLPIGLKGICCGKGGIVTYNIGEKTSVGDTKLLQIDTYSPQKKYFLKIGAVDSENRKYVATKNVECTDTFVSSLFSLNSFKDENLCSLEHWEGLKCLKIATAGVVVGKIMFI